MNWEQEVISTVSGAQKVFNKQMPLLLLEVSDPVIVIFLIHDVSFMPYMYKLLARKYWMKCLYIYSPHLYPLKLLASLPTPLTSCSERRAVPSSRDWGIVTPSKNPELETGVSDSRPGGELWPRGQIPRPPISVNKVSLEHLHPVVNGCFHATRAELNSCFRDCMICNA